MLRSRTTTKAAHEKRKGRPNTKTRIVAALALVFFAFAPRALAEDFACEVMSVEGRASAREGDVLRAGDVLTTGADSAADLAFDSGWNNVVRVEAASEIKIESLYPTRVALSKGGVFSRLKDLPEESSFEVRTPTAVAAVRGTEYRTTLRDDGVTDVYSFSESPVYVYGTDESGVPSGEPAVLAARQRSSVLRRGARPDVPRRMSDGQSRAGLAVREKLESRVRAVRGAGRKGKVQDLGRVREELRRRPREASPFPDVRKSGEAPAEGKPDPSLPQKFGREKRPPRTQVGQERLERKQEKKKRQKKRHYTKQSSG